MNPKINIHRNLYDNKTIYIYICIYYIYILCSKLPLFDCSGSRHSVYNYLTLDIDIRMCYISCPDTISHWQTRNFMDFQLQRNGNQNHYRNEEIAMVCYKEFSYMAPDWLASCCPIEAMWETRYQLACFRREIFHSNPNLNISCVFMSEGVPGHEHSHYSLNACLYSTCCKVAHVRDTNTCVLPIDNTIWTPLSLLLHYNFLEYSFIVLFIYIILGCFTTQIIVRLSRCQKGTLNLSFPWQNGRHFAEDIFKYVFLMKMYWFWLKFHWS